jgi:hypothetical protein
MDAKIPSRYQPEDDDHLTDEARCFRPDAVDQHAVHDPQQGAGQQRYRDHQPFLAGIEVQIIGDLDAKRAQNDPHHKAHVEIEEGGRERRRMPCLEERFVDHCSAVSDWYGWKIVTQSAILRCLYCARLAPAF